MGFPAPTGLQSDEDAVAAAPLVVPIPKSPRHGPSGWILELGLLDGPARESSSCPLRRCVVLSGNPDENSVVASTVDDDPVVVFSSPA